MDYFINKPDQALPQHLKLARAAFKRALEQDGDLLYTSSQLAITAARTYASVAKFVVLEDIVPKEINLGIYSTMWTPESPYDMECDFDGTKRFKVLDFAVDKVEAEAVIKAIRQQRRV